MATFYAKNVAQEVHYDMPEYSDEVINLFQGG